MMLSLLYRVTVVSWAEAAAPRVGIVPWFYSNPLDYSRHIITNGRGESSPLARAALKDPEFRMDKIAPPCCDGCRYGNAQCLTSCSKDHSLCRNDAYSYFLNHSKTAFYEDAGFEQCFKHSDVAFKSGCAKLCESVDWYIAQKSKQYSPQRFLSASSDLEKPKDDLEVDLSAATNALDHWMLLTSAEEEAGDIALPKDLLTFRDELQEREQPSGNASVPMTESLFRNNILSQSKTCSKVCKINVLDECMLNGCPCGDRLKGIHASILRDILNDVKLVFTFANYPMPRDKVEPFDVCFAYGLARCVGQSWPKSNWMVY